MKWAFKGNCDDDTCYCCYFDSAEHEMIYQTEEAALRAAKNHFPDGNERYSPFNFTLYEVRK